MKLTITIHSQDESFLEEVERDVENACCYYCGDALAPDVECAFGDNDDNHRVVTCRRCGVEYYHCDDSASGLCCDCEDEMREEKEVAE